MIKSIIFYMFAVIAVSSGLAIIASANIVRMAYCLIAMLMAVSGLYFLQGAYFLAVIQIIIYAGGVAVLMVFGVMLTSRQLGSGFVPKGWELAGLIAAAAFLLSGLWLAISTTHWPQPVERAANTTADFGLQLLGKFIGPFELASVLLLIALLGAAYLAKPKVPTLQKKNPHKDRTGVTP